MSVRKLDTVHRSLRPPPSWRNPPLGTGDAQPHAPKSLWARKARRHLTPPSAFQLLVQRWLDFLEQAHRTRHNIPFQPVPLPRTSRKLPSAPLTRHSLRRSRSHKGFDRPHILGDELLIYQVTNSTPAACPRRGHCGPDGSSARAAKPRSRLQSLAATHTKLRRSDCLCGLG